ncbi:MAG: beta-ketoacyl synthase N-terminal-like domain-containing protein, partial [Acidobacteriota bacterium]
MSADRPIDDDPDAAALDARAIAVIGLDCRVPGASDAATFWRLLCAGRDAVVRWPAPAGFVRAHGALAGVARFDAARFGLSPADAAALDPQQRLLLLSAWRALEDAGLAVPRRAADAGPRIGVFVAGGLSPYGLAQLQAHADDPEADPVQLDAVGALPDHLAPRLAHHLGLRGPALGVQATCAGGLAAVHQAVWALRHGLCDVALAGGVRVATPFDRPLRWRAGGPLSPSGRCRPFDAEAEGIVGGSGVGVVVLRPLDAAQAHGDPIRAVIRGIALTQDGGVGAGYRAPAADGQVDAYRAALADAGLAPSAIDVVETHGAGTPVGDAVELAALAAVYGRDPSRRAAPLVLGGVKSNLGHLDAAAGIVGLIKTALMLERAHVPPTLHHAAPRAELADLPFAVGVAGRDWPMRDAHASSPSPRRAAVTAIGLGGTNVHAVLTSPPPSLTHPASGAPALVPVSAISEAACAAAARRIGAHLARRPAALDAIAQTLQDGRRPA